MSNRRRLHLGAFMRPVTIHTGAWRYPGAWPEANFSFPRLKYLIQRLEAGKFDAFFMADHLALLNMPIEALRRSHTVTSFDPLTLLPALAAVTERIGLIATASTTYNDPYHVARKFASLDHISNGRAGWNVVTTANPDAALNFGHDAHMAHGERYKRAREFYDVVTGLWDSFADDAFIRDVESGIFWDPAKMHVLDHKGEELSVRGPLNVARPVQGWPVIVQAGASDAGRQLAAETAEMVFAAGGPIADAQALLRRREGPRGARRPRPGRHQDPARRPGRGRRHGRGGAGQARPSRQPGALRQRHRLPVDRARRRRPRLRPGRPAAGDPGDRGQQERPRARHRPGAARGADGAATGAAAGRLWRARRSSARRPPSPTPWRNGWRPGACDGFNVMFPHVPDGLDDFVDRVVPELQRRGLFRTRIRGHDAARPSRPGAAGEPLLRARRRAPPNRPARIRAGRGPRPAAVVRPGTGRCR